MALPSFCSANPWVLRAIFQALRERRVPVLIEATCNQVNQHGGYMNMTPSDFRSFVFDLAAACGFDTDRVILGGDHLGPNPWKAAPAHKAMSQAAVLVEHFARAGFAKIHLDASMGCADDDNLSEQAVAERAASLCARCEAASGGVPPVYVIGTEVPTPGGVVGEERELEVTRGEDIRRTVDTHRAAFARLGLDAAWERVVALVVQPGVEFANHAVVPFEAAKAGHLPQALGDCAGLCYEAHSTDYQNGEALHRLVEHGFGFLKVGPELTYAFREAVLTMAHMERYLLPPSQRSHIVAVVLEEMVQHPEHWRSYYSGGAQREYDLLFSFSDRIRYYWSRAPVRQALERLFHNVNGARRRASLLHQFLADDDLESAAGSDDLAGWMIRSRVGTVVRKYYGAVD